MLYEGKNEPPRLIKPHQKLTNQTIQESVLFPKIPSCSDSKLLGWCGRELVGVKWKKTPSGRHGAQLRTGRVLRHSGPGQPYRHDAEWSGQREREEASRRVAHTFF